jgi:hypothetical protein
MAKMKQRIDINQASLFDLLKNYQEENHASRPAGSFDIDRQFRELISQALKNCPLSRWQVAARMSELTGHEITKAMLDSWTAESKEAHRFPGHLFTSILRGSRRQRTVTDVGETGWCFCPAGAGSAAGGDTSY